MLLPVSLLRASALTIWQWCSLDANPCAGQLCQLHLHHQGRHPRELHRGPDHQVRCPLSHWPVLGPLRSAHVAGLCRSLSDTLTKKNKNSNVKAFMVKNYLSVFINAMIENPAFDSQVPPRKPSSLQPACSHLQMHMAKMSRPAACAPYTAGCVRTSAGAACMLRQCERMRSLPNCTCHHEPLLGR